jgi:thiol-disulfide isomerase/thioredoxin
VRPDPVVAPDFTERDIHNVETISLANYRGKVVLLNFWGPWCPPCRAEVPALEKLQDAFKDKLVIIGATVFSPEAAVEKFYKDYRINYPVIWGSYDLMDKYGKVSVFPTTIIIDRNGVIADTVRGSRTREQFEAMLKPLLAE